MCAREYASVFRDPKLGKYARDLVECLILARGAVLSKVAGIEELATYASWTTRAAGGRVVVNFDEHITEATKSDTLKIPIPMWPVLMISCSAIVGAVVAWKAHAPQLMAHLSRYG
jgi:hypothetical protein